MVWQCASAVDVPVVGIGGVATGRDALEFLVAGAAAVQVGTATLTEPGAGPRIVAEVERYLDQQGIGSVRELIGTLIT